MPKTRLLGVLAIFVGALVIMDTMELERKGVVHVAGKYRRNGRDIIDRAQYPDDFRKEIGPRWLLGGILLIGGVALYAMSKTP